LGTTETRNLAEARVATRLDGKWFLDALLGFGGSAAVYAATHRNGKRAALKVLHPHCVADESLRSRFVREGYVANKIGHPRAVSILDDDVAEDGTVYLVMELLEGASLEKVGRGEAPPLMVAEVVRIADDLLDVLIKAHAIGIVHRDIKPANLFVTKDGELKVLDFGIARLAEATLDGSSATQTGFMMGTPAFMPPEQARARWADVDGRSDLWAVGATMISLLIARRPRLAETANEELLLAMTSPLPPAASLAPHLPPSVAAVIDRAVAFNREDRFRSAEAMQHALRIAVRESEPRLNVPATLIATASVQVPFVNATMVAPITGPRTGPRLPGPPFGSGPISASDLEPAYPGMTTSRAVLHSAAPGAPKKSSAGAIAVVLGIALAVALASAVLYVRSRGTPADRRTAAGAETTTAVATTTTTTDTAPPTGTAPPVADGPVGTTPTSTTPPAATTSTPTIVPTVTTAPKFDGKTAKPTGPRPHASGSANPSKYFDTRF
jgi:serine/threonine-protein kinase